MLTEVPKDLPEPKDELVRVRDTLSISGVDPPVIQVDERRPSQQEVELIWFEGLQNMLRNNIVEA